MIMPGRSYTFTGNSSLNRYRFGQNGIEKSDEVAGVGNHYTALYGEYDPRIVHRWNTDPKPVEWESPYAMFRGNPVLYSDPLLDYSKIGAKIRSFFTGGRDVGYSKVTGEWSYTKETGDGWVERRDGLSETERRSRIEKYKESHSYIENIGWVKKNTTTISADNTPEHMKVMYRAQAADNQKMVNTYGNYNITNPLAVGVTMRSAFTVIAPQVATDVALAKFATSINSFLTSASGSAGIAEGFGAFANTNRTAFAAKGGGTFYRSMSSEAAETFLSTGRMPAGTETFISPTKSFAQNYSGTLFEINVKPGTLSQLESIGVRNAAAGHPYSHLPLVGRGWKGTNAFFKVEGTQVNIGLGNGNALNIFNSNIHSFRVIP